MCFCRCAWSELLPAGETATAVMGIDFCDSTQAANFQLWWVLFCTHPSVQASGPERSLTWFDSKIPLPLLSLTCSCGPVLIFHSFWICALFIAAGQQMKQYNSKLNIFLLNSFLSYWCLFLFFSTHTRKFFVSIQPPVGELMRPVFLTENEFKKEQGEWWKESKCYKKKKKTLAPLYSNSVRISHFSYFLLY